MHVETDERGMQVERGMHVDTLCAMRGEQVQAP
jgi:hypothetical protein